MPTAYGEEHHKNVSQSNKCISEFNDHVYWYVRIVETTCCIFSLVENIQFEFQLPFLKLW